MGFNNTHSNFEYFSNGGFRNIEPFDDLNVLMSRVMSKSRVLKKGLP